MQEGPDLPKHLVTLYSALGVGKAREAIATLAEPRYDLDADAQLLLARCLAADDRHADAARTFDRAAALSDRLLIESRVGKARSLLALGRAAEALEVTTRLPHARSDVIEIRIAAFEALGREDEALVEKQRAKLTRDV